MVSGVPVWRRGRDLAHEMQTAGELAGLEGTISLWRTEHTGVTPSGTQAGPEGPRRPFQQVITSGAFSNRDAR